MLSRVARGSHPDAKTMAIFVSMTRRPPTSTLFPTRRSSDLHPLAGLEVPLAKHASISINDLLTSEDLQRSEEHTSELQSRPHLVCRLLLEKKKKKTRLRMQGSLSARHLRPLQLSPRRQPASQ